MYTITAAQAPGGGTADLWAAVSALHLLDQAIEQVGAACAAAGELVQAAHWQNSGVRALRWALADLHGRLADERGELLFQRDQVARAVWS